MRERQQDGRDSAGWASRARTPGSHSSHNDAMDAPSAPDPAVVGVDFTSRPTPRKPITVARGQRSGDVVQLKTLSQLPGDDAFAHWLAAPGPWVGAFDF